MQIRTRLTLQFLFTGGVIMIVLSVAIYYSSAIFRKEDFFYRLRDNARSSAEILVDSLELERIATEYPLMEFANGKIIIINFLNDTIYSDDDRSEIEIRPDIVERVRLYKKTSYRQGMYDVVGTLYTDSIERFVVIAAATDIDGIQHLKKLRVILVFVCLTGIILFAAAGWIYAGKALKPISRVIKRVEDISISSLNLRVPEGNGTDEIGHLAKTFNNMLGRLESSIKVQKDFISNASHELRTPLTSINGQLEVLLMKDRPSEEYKDALRSVLDDLRSLTDLTNRLLLMARAGSGNQNYFQKIRTDELLWQIREEMQKSRKDCRINISLDESLTDSDQMLVTGDEYLLKTSFTNIIDNAFKYSNDKSVDIKIEHSSRHVKIYFRDRGIGIAGEDINKIFEPFYRAANSKSVPGTGIGLSLVRQIIINHKGNIEITSGKGTGTTVIITLPLN